MASSCEAGKASQSTRTALNSEGLELAHIPARQVQELGLVLHSRVSPVVLEELLDLVREHAKQRNALGKRPPPPAAGTPPHSAMPERLASLASRHRKPAQ